MACPRRSDLTVIDGTIVATWRMRCVSDQNRRHVHRKKIYGITCRPSPDEHSNLLWISDGLPGYVHDLNATRPHTVIEAVVRHQARL